MYVTGSRAVLARGVGGDVAHRSRAVERDERDQVLELGRLDRPQRVAHPGRLELEDAVRLGLREHLVGLRVVERERGDVEAAADEVDRLVDHVEVAQSEEVDLQQAERLDVLHRELRHDLLVGAFLLQRHDVDQRAGADHHPRRVDRVLPDEAFERLGEVHDLARDRVAVIRGLQLRRRASDSRRASGPGLRGSASRSCRRRRTAPRARGRRRGRRRARPSSRR